MRNYMFQNMRIIIMSIVTLITSLVLLNSVSFAADANTWGATDAYRVARMFVMHQSRNAAHKIALDNGFKGGDKKNVGDLTVVFYSIKESSIFSPRLPIIKLIFSDQDKLTAVMIAFDRNTLATAKKARADLSIILGKPSDIYIDIDGDATGNGPNYGVNFETSAIAEWNTIALTFGKWGSDNVLFIERCGR